MTRTPPDRSGVPTEAVLESVALDAVSIEERLELMNREDAGVAAAVARALPQIALVVRAVSERSAAGGRLVYLGAGTSGRLGVLDASECPPTFMTAPEEVVGVIAGGDASLRTSSEGLEDDPDGAGEAIGQLGIGSSDAVLGITAGGTTPYVLGGLALAGRRGAYTALLTCGAASGAESGHDVIRVDCGPEVVAGSTRLKAGTATKMVLNMISTSVMVERGKVHDNLMVDLRATNDKLRDRAARVISLLTGAEREESFALLDRAHGGVKAAVVMRRLGVTYQEASRVLDAAGGRLRDALEGARG